VLSGGVKQRFRALAREIEIPMPFDLTDFCARLERQRGRIIRLFPITSMGAVSGVWVSTAEADYIYYEAGTTRLHRTHIVLHEIAHMLLGHKGGAWIRDDIAQLLAPALSDSLVQLILGRGAYTSAEERDAEVMASLILHHAARAVAPAPVTRPDVAAAIDLIDRAWGRGRRGAST
jgi:hypothetical protein